MPNLHNRALLELPPTAWLPQYPCHHLFLVCSEVCHWLLCSTSSADIHAGSPEIIADWTLSNLLHLSSPLPLSSTPHASRSRQPVQTPRPPQHTHTPSPHLTSGLAALLHVSPSEDVWFFSPESSLGSLRAASILPAADDVAKLAREDGTIAGAGTLRNGRESARTLS